MKYEIASEEGIELKEGYNGNITAKSGATWLINDRICPKAYEGLKVRPARALSSAISYEKSDFRHIFFN